jgi:hypothetical protein
MVGIQVERHEFLTAELDGGEWLASRLGRFTPGETASGTHWIGGWVGPGDGLDAVEKRKIPPSPPPPGIELPTPSSSLQPVAIPTGLPPFSINIRRRYPRVSLGGGRAER